MTEQQKLAYLMPHWERLAPRTPGGLAYVRIPRPGAREVYLYLLARTRRGRREAIQLSVWGYYTSQREEEWRN